ncbi:hypothetical protein GIB67_019371 [Kingdonia uniflora]|uniref:RRM domain-containing protein n=1 Tax=Kingdonia uniflora TaxID=39325 RepID=A0A7J7M1M3_9MAGN|nr:hypothetical protein GIB67_019371 [Kingdonia uniflora]
MSHFGRTGPPDITDTYSLLVLNITFRTTADDLFPLFDKYGKVVDIFIPRDRRTGDSRGFAFVRYKYAEEAQKAVEKIDGRNVDGREIRVQFAKYGPNAERISKGRIIETSPPPKTRGRSRSRSPRPSEGGYYNIIVKEVLVNWDTPPAFDEYMDSKSDVGEELNRDNFLSKLPLEYADPILLRHEDDYHGKDRRKRSRSRSRDRYDRVNNRGRDKDYRRRSRSRSVSPDYRKGRGRDRYVAERGRSQSRSLDSASPARSPVTRRSPSPRKKTTSRADSPDRHGRGERSLTPKSLSPRRKPADSRSPSPRRRPAGSRGPSPHSSDADAVPNQEQDQQRKLKDKGLPGPSYLQDPSTENLSECCNFFGLLPSGLCIYIFN